MRAIVLGRQGSGKGTQGQFLAASLGIPHLSTGALFRAEVAAGTPLGHSVAAALDVGALVPDDLVLDVVLGRLRGAMADGAGYLLDGFPRTLAQADALFEGLGRGAVDVAIEIDVPVEVVLPRLAARGRHDDNEEAVLQRLAHYEEETAPLLIWLDSHDLLVTVDGVGRPEAVAERVLAAVQARSPAVST